MRRKECLIDREMSRPLLILSCSLVRRSVQILTVGFWFLGGTGGVGFGESFWVQIGH